MAANMKPRCEVCLAGGGDLFFKKGCACRGGADNEYGHIGCYAEFARTSMRAVDPELPCAHREKAAMAWSTCPTCKQPFSGPFRIHMSAARFADAYVQPLTLNAWWERSASAHDYGRSAWHEGRVREANLWFSYALEVMHKMGPEMSDEDRARAHELRLQALHGVAMCDHKSGNVAAAAHVYEHLLCEAMRRHPAASPHVLHLRLSLVRCKNEADPSAATAQEVEQVIIQTLAAYSAAYGRNHRLTLRMEQSLCRHRLGYPKTFIMSDSDCSEANAASAAAALKDVWSRQMQLLGAQHDDAQSTLVMYACAMTRLNRASEALDVAKAVQPRNHRLVLFLSREAARALNLRRSRRVASVRATADIAAIFAQKSR